MGVVDQIEPLCVDDLKKGIRVPAPDFEAWLQRFDWTYHQLGRNEYPPPFGSLDEFQLACICADPVLWCGAFLKSLEDPEEPYTFFDYQKESVRYHGDALHEDGSEVGKSREIHALCLYYAYTRYRGSGLICAPQSIYYIEILDMIDEQLSLSKDLERSRVVYRKNPHPHMRWTNGFKLDFRPTDVDGKPLRGVHAQTFGIMDEAVKAKNKVIFDEFWRAGKPGCIFRLYSVPDGDRSCEFFRLCQKADGKQLDENDEHENNPDEPEDFKKFHWPKTVMPQPFWTPKRRLKYIKQYDGEDSPGYRHNVLGLWGDPENSVFPWYQFERLLKDIPEYRCMKILVDDAQGEVSILGTRLAVPANDQGEAVKPQEQVLCDRRMSKADFAIGAEIKAFFSKTPGLTFAGADLGFSQDPTEIYVKLIFGRTHRLVARLQLKGVSYDLQAEAIDALDDIYDAAENKMGWGVDFGNAGSAVVHILHNQERYFHKRYEDRLTGYQFGATYDAVDEDGNIIMNRYTKKPVKLSAKELSTDLLVKKMQRIETEYPYDPDLMLYYPNHTYREGQNHRIYKKEDDHVIDADRAVTLRIILPDDGVGDLFASGN